MEAELGPTFSDFGRLAEMALSMTVRIETHGRGSGSGVLLDATGTIATNAHVATSPNVKVHTQTGVERDGEVITRNTAQDLAVVKADVDGVASVEFRDEATLRPGEIVIAAGNPWNRGPAVALGVIHTAITPHGLIAVDIRLAPGYSGGPLLDTRGRLVGINSMIAGGSGVAVSAAKLERLIEGTPRSRLGIEIFPDAVVINGSRGVLVRSVQPDGVAGQSGVLVGDVIVGVDGQNVSTGNELKKALTGSAVVTTLSLLRGGKAIGLQVNWMAAQTTGARAA